MALGTNIANEILNERLAGAVVSVHTGDPGATGAAELVGAGRAAAAFAAASGGAAALAAAAEISGLTPGAVITHLGLWVGGTFFNGGALAAPVTVPASGIVQIPAGALVMGIGEGGGGDEPGGPVSLAIIPADRRTIWDPGIPGGIPTERVVLATLTGLTADGTGDNTAAINSAITAAGAAYAPGGPLQEVVLPAGTFRCTGRIRIGVHGVVLRGQGATTRIRHDVAGENPISITISRQNFFGPIAAHGPFRLTQDGSRGSREIVLTNANAASILVGDILCIDEEDDLTYLRQGGSYIYTKRQPGGGDNWGPGLRTTGAWRSVSSLICIEEKSVGATHTTLTLRDPLHMNFRTSQYAEVWHLCTKYEPSRALSEGIHYSGIEDLYTTGGGVEIARGAYCWIKGVEVDGNPGTANIGSYSNAGGTGDTSLRVTQSYRCIVRSNYVHHKRAIQQGGGGYLLNISAYTSETLVEDNICVFGNKLIVGEMMGGGNVFAYNYADGAATAPAGGWQEGGINMNHRMHTHNALIEGNEAVNIGSDTTHGSAGLHVFFRNFAYGRNREKLYGSYPYTVGADDTFQRAAGTDGYHREATFIGNVLHADETVAQGSRIYQQDHLDGIGGATVWRIGQAWEGRGEVPDDGQALAETYRHLNFDNATDSIADEDPSNTEPLPASLYLTEKPAWFGAVTWPPFDPRGSTEAERIGALPAKLRYDAIVGG